MECTVGSITNDIIKGRGTPIFDYPLIISLHYPGRLLSGFLAVPFYHIFGESGLSVKLMFLTVSAGIVCLVYLFLNKFFSRKAAIIASILMIFSIPVYTLSTMSQGSPQIESVFFEILIMFIFYKIFFDKKQNIEHFVLFGIVAGFAVFVNYISLVMIFTCFLFWFIFDKRFFMRKKFFIFVVFFLLGLSPWIYYNLAHDFIALNFGSSGVSFISRLFGHELSFSRLTEIIIKFKDLIIYDLPKSFMFKDTLFFTSSFLSYTYYLLFICSFIFLLYYCRKSIKKLIFALIPLKRFNTKPEKIKKETFILVYPIIFILIYCISSFSIDHFRFGAFGYRYLVTFYVFMIIIISIFVSHLWNKRTKKLSILLIIILLLLGLIGNLSFVSFSDIGKGVVYRHYCYDRFGHRYESGKRYISPIDSYQSISYAGYALSIKSRTRGANMKLTESIKYCGEMDKEYKCFCYNGLGQLISWHDRNNITYVILQFNKLDENYRHCFYRGIGWTYGENWAHNYPNLHHLCNEIDNKYKPYCFEGLGQGMAQYIGVIPTQAIRQCNKVEPKYRSYCFKGLAWSLAEKFGDNPAGASKFAKYVDDKYKDYFYEGMGAYIGLMFGYNLTRANEECDKFDKNSIYCIQGLNQYFNEIKYN